jgi:two-component system response regulator YesN
MPRLSGLEFAAVLREESPRTRVVVLSGYDNFRYAQKAIELNVFSYLLKPVKEEHIHDVFGRLKDELDRDASERREESKRERATVDLSATRALFDVPDVHDREVLERHFGNSVLHLRPMVMEYHTVVPTGQATSDRGDPARALRQLSTVIRNTAGLQDVLTHVSHNTNQLWCIVANDSDPRRGMTRRLLEIGLAVRDKHGRVSVSAAVGPEVGSVEELGSAARETEALLQHRLHLGLNRLIDRETVDEIWQPEESGGQEVSEGHDVDSFAAEFVAGIVNSDPPRFRSAIEEFLSRFYHTKARSIRVVSASIAMFLHAVREQLNYFGGNFESILGNEEEILAQIDACASLDQIQRVLESFAHAGSGSFAERYGGTRHREIIRILERINSDLSQPMPLDGLAEEFGFSASHFSRMFKEIVGENFKDYLSRKRMEEAKRLLAETDLKVYEIACRVGYADQHYFSEAFRKRVGYTPREYRNGKVDCGR